MNTTAQPTTIPIRHTQFGWDRARGYRNGFTEASSIGWPPGHFPQTFLLVTPEDWVVEMFRTLHSDSQVAKYLGWSDNGFCFRADIFND